MGDQNKKTKKRRILSNRRNEARGKNSSDLTQPKVRTGRRVADRRRGRRRTKKSYQEVHQKRNTAI
jgi:hypothetical protein